MDNKICKECKEEFTPICDDSQEFDFNNLVMISCQVRCLECQIEYRLANAKNPMPRPIQVTHL